MDIFEQQRLWLHVIIPLLALGVVLLYWGPNYMGATSAADAR